MKIEKLFFNLSKYKDLIFYLFEHRDKVVVFEEIEKFISFEKLEVLESFEIVEVVEYKVFLDGRVIVFLENYLNIDDNIEVSIIHEKINHLKHKIDILLEYKDKQNKLIPQIRIEIKKSDFILLQNLFKLRIHIDRVYKNIAQFKLKLIELKYYESKLKDLSIALSEFEKFIKLYTPKLAIFYNGELNIVLENAKLNIHEISKSLIPLTQDVCEYINKATAKNIFIEKITKLKELKDSFTIKEQTDILNIIEKYEPLQNSITIKTKLDQDILLSDDFKMIFDKSKKDIILKTKKADKIKLYDEQMKHDFLDIYSIHLNFKFSKQNLIEFLLGYTQLQNKEFDDILQVYCKLILLYETEYKIYDESIDIDGIKFKKVHYDK
jgi:uncharacterized membrane protein